MIIFLIVSAIGRIFMPHDAILVNQKLKGYWLVVEDNRNEEIYGDSLIVAKFYKCTSAQRKDHLCNYDWSVLDNTAVTKFKINKEVKKNWTPNLSRTYWVEKKRDKKTKREIIHIDGFEEISINLIKKEIEFYKGDSMMVKIRKLK